MKTSQSHSLRGLPRALQVPVRLGALALLLTTQGSAVMAQAPTPAATASAKPAQAAPGTAFSATQLASLLPSAVYFAGRTAPLQLRNAGAVQLAGGGIVWVALVDSSGYSTSVQERYQFYLVTEGTVHFGDVELRPGAYGGGFVGNRFALMDLGNHTIGEGNTQEDAAMRRPRPLQLLPDQQNAAKLYLGRRYITIRAGA